MVPLLGEAPETALAAEVRTTPTFKYHLLCDVHHPGVTNSV